MFNSKYIQRLVDRIYSLEKKIRLLEKYLNIQQITITDDFWSTSSYEPIKKEKKSRK